MGGVMNDLISRAELFNRLAPVKTIGEAFEVIQDMPTAYTDAEIQKMQDLEQAQFEEIRRLAYEEGYKDARKVKEVGTCTDCVYGTRYGYQYPCNRCIRIASCGHGRDGDYYEDEGRRR